MFQKRNLVELLWNRGSEAKGSVPSTPDELPNSFIVGMASPRATLQRNVSHPSWIKNNQVDTPALKQEVDRCVKLIQNDDAKFKKQGADKLHSLITLVWAQDTKYARDAAEIVCEYTRVAGGLESLLQAASLSTPNEAVESADTKDLQLSVTRVLEQIMVAENRQYISQHAQFPALLVLTASTESIDHVRYGTGILENLFKVSPKVSLKLIQSDGLDGIMYGCRYTDEVVLQHCAAALANCALFGSPQVHKAMLTKHADHWLFPLAFSNNSVVKYYALIAICILASDPHMGSLVSRSGTLDLVIPFLHLQDPLEFPRICPMYAHGQTKAWLERLVPLLECGCDEAQSLASFHFAMEAKIKQKQKRLQIFVDINLEAPLTRVAREGSQLTSKFACQALEIMGRSLPSYHQYDVLSWTPNQVSQWVKDIGLSDLSTHFLDHLVTGDMLVDITSDELEALDFKSPLVRRWFLQKVVDLRRSADFSTNDPEHICRWLVSLSPDLARYKVDFMRNGVTREILPMMTNETLEDMGVANLVQRLKILVAIEKLALTSGHDSPDMDCHLRSIHPALRKRYDVFLSYRRSSGSQLASLLKVHLQLRGLNVFLDVTGLGSGKFDDALLTTIANSLNMVVVLTPNALDRCIGDVTTQDWVHRELIHAIDCGVHLVPVLDRFNWPDADQLPLGIKPLCNMNGVSWSHEYQEACVDKLVSFLHLPASARRRSMFRNESQPGT